MSTELEQMTAAGGTIVLGGKTYLLKQLSLGDYGQIQAWLRQKLPRPFAVVAVALKDLEPLKEFDPDGYESMRKELLLAAMADAKSADGVGAPPNLIEQAMNSPEGLALMLWLCLRKEHPAATYEEIEAAVLNEDLSTIRTKLDDINLFPEADEEEQLGESGADKEGGANPPKGPKRKKT